jgi:hypothetical protein
METELTKEQEEYLLEEFREKDYEKKFVRIVEDDKELWLEDD